jgi:hypothetical protein
MLLVDLQQQFGQAVISSMIYVMPSNNNKVLRIHGVESAPPKCTSRILKCGQTGFSAVFKGFLFIRLWCQSAHACALRELIISLNLVY